MNNPFKNFVNKLSEEKNKEEAEQLAREQRLKELEDSIEHGKFNLFDPLKGVRDKKEARSIRREIEQYRQKKENKNKIVLSIVAILAIVCIGSIGILAEKSSNTNTNNTASSENTVTQQVAQTNTAENITDKEQQSGPKTIETPALISDVNDGNTVDNTVKVQEDRRDDSHVYPNNIVYNTTENEAENKEDDYDGIKLSASDLSVTYRTEFAHISKTSIALGNDESAKICIVAGKPDITYNDMIIAYDESLLNIDFAEPQYSENSSVFDLSLSGNKEGSTDIVIVTKYDIYSKGEDAEGYTIYVHKYDSTDGRIVYVTDTGDAFHLKSSCAGNGAIATTYTEAVALEFKPCGKCAKGFQ